MPIWSTAKRSAAREATDAYSSARAKGDEQGVAPAVTAWLSALPQVTGPDTALGFSLSEAGQIDLTSAHASGLAQLLAGRRTRLSTLVRERQDYTIAARAARNLRAKIYELANERGIDAGYLAAGLASWTSAVGGRPRRVNAPVLLAGVLLTVRPEQDDFELKLTEQARLNPALVRHLRSVHGVEIDPQTIERLAYSTARLDPQPVLDHIASLLGGIPGAAVVPSLLIATVADLAGSLDEEAINAGHPLVSALAEASADDAAAEAPGSIDATAFPSIDKRDPGSEMLVLDADAEQQLVLDAVRAGDSLVVEAPPGTGQTQTAVNALAALVDMGRSVLVVAERRESLAELNNACL